MVEEIVLRCALAKEFLYRPGMANALAVCVDSLEKPHIIGSVAGDDTILLVVKTEEIAKEVSRELRNSFGMK